MRMEAGRRHLTVIGILLESDAGDVILGREGKNNEECRLIWKVRDREIQRYLVSCQGWVPWEKCEFCGPELYVYFLYAEKRPMAGFLQKGKEKEDICMEILALCMSCRVPWALLLLVLESDALNIRKDGSVYMTYELEIGNIHPEAGEKDCVQTCGEYMLSLLERDEEYVLSCWKEGKKNLRKFWEKRKKKRRIQLLRKKLDRRRYQTFLELYRDFRHREPMHIRLKASLPKNNRVFYILFALGIILNLLAAGTLVCFLITGEVPLFRLFSGSLEKIGTVWMK